MVKQVVTDEELKLKQQARRRLFGAIALTILVVTLLPMLLDSEPPTPKQNIDLKIPDKDQSGEFVKMVLPPESASAVPAMPLASAPVIAPLLNAKPVVETPVQPVETKPTVNIKAVDAKNNAEPVPHDAGSAAKLPKAETKVVTKEVTKKHSGYVLQVGAFSKAISAKKLQEKLHKQGYPSYTEKAGDKVRVRIGDYRSNAEAEKIRRQLEIQGYKPNVIHLK